VLRAFLDYKRALGFRYERPEGPLRHFDRHVARTHRSGDRTPDLRHVIQSWLTQGQERKPISVATNLGVIGQFCLHRRRNDPAGFVPGREWFPQESFRPVVTDKQSAKVCAAAFWCLEASPHS
jgi:integrase/recombinase XerD